MQPLEQQYSGQAEGESDLNRMCQYRMELQKSSLEPTIAAAVVLEASIVREAHDCQRTLFC